MTEFDKITKKARGRFLHAERIETIQINVGRHCNLSCCHCHLECGPDRDEVMPWEVMEMVVDAADVIAPVVVDITGGAPELNPEARRLIEALDRGGHSVQMRTNLVALTMPGMEDTPAFLRENRVRLLASLPCYEEKNVCAQRGPDVYERSIEALRYLNDAGYGSEGGPAIDIVFNPGDSSLPGDQQGLERDFRESLERRHGITFSRLLTITNMPIGRFRTLLERQNEYDSYLRLLRESFNPGTVDQCMCRRQVCFRWDGVMHDCDFNLALDLPVDHGTPDHVSDIDIQALTGRRIVTGDHCFACTAGRGSSCSGSLLSGAGD